MIEKTNKLTRKEVLYTNEHFKFHFLDALQFDSPDKNSSSIHPPFVHEWFPQQQPPRSLRDTVIHLTVDLYSLSIHIHAIKDQTEDSNAPQSSPTDSIHDFEPSSTLRHLSTSDIIALLPCSLYTHLGRVPGSLFINDWTSFQKSSQLTRLHMFNNSQDLLILHKNEHQGLDLINERIQTILPFFIEGASPIESGDPRWTFFILLRFMPSSSQLNIFSPEKKIKYGSKHIAQDSSSYSDGLYSTDSISYHHKSSSNIMIKPLGTESSTVGEKKFFKDESEAFENNKSSFHSLGGHDKNGNITSHLNVDQKQIHSPQILAYCSCYDFFRFPNGIRRRISQFITLFPFQKCGFGSILYRHIIYQSSGIPSALGPIHSSLTQNNDSKNFINSHHEPNSLSTTNENNSAKLNALQTSEKTLTKEMKADVHEKIEPYHLQTENIKEISVEDPSPAFSDFRLINDTRLLIENHEKSAEDFKFSPLQVSECNLALNYIRGELKDSDLKRHVLKKHQESIPLASGKERSQIIKTLMDKERCRLRKLFVDYTKIHNTPVPLESTT